MVDSGWLKRDETPDGELFSAGGRWDIANAGHLDAELTELPSIVTQGAIRRVTFDIAGLEVLDTVGAWLLHRTLDGLRAEGVDVGLRGAHPRHAALLEQVAASYRPCQTAPPPRNAFVRMVENLGEATLTVLETVADYVSFLGRAILVTARTALRPGRFRLTSTVFHIEQVGLDALPIVSLISFLIGVVLAYQGGMQLERFGAQVFVVDLIAVSILRELGILLTAIVIAGRSGSAFTAQIGSMKVHEEVDALRTLGLDPMELLVLPRVLALIISLPLLAFVADIMGLLGGGLMCWIALDIGPGVFLESLKAAVDIGSFWVGIIKAPVFALLIALVGCYEGMQVSGSAESVGQQTTRAVVESIFSVIVMDALFSIFFSIIGL